MLFPFLLAAQNGNHPFETFSAGIHYQSNINRNEFHDYWLSDGGLGAFFAAPFYFGEAQFGIDYSFFSAKSREQPDFTSLFIYLQWGYRFNLIRNTSLLLHASVGLYQMDFSDPVQGSASGNDHLGTEVNTGLLSERELAAGISATFSYSFYGNWSINLQLIQLNIFTYKKIRLLNLNIGISKKFSSPQWLKDFLN